MTSGWTLVEPCCGSAAFTLHMLGARRPLVPYQGTKWPLREQLAALAVRLGFWGAPSRVVLGDVSPWATVMETVFRQRTAVLEALRPIVEQGHADPEGVYAGLHGGLVPPDAAQTAAELLWLQRMAFGGKAVGVGDGRWKAPGLNHTSAYGVEGTERFGEVLPLGPALLREVKHLPRFEHVRGFVGTIPTEVEGPTLVLLDPPYAGTTAYPCGDMSRDEAVAYANAWTEAGAAVVICEAAPIELDGWRTERLSAGVGRRMGTGARQAPRVSQEWVTFRAARAAVRAA